jgi:hypothetical protein
MAADDNKDIETMQQEQSLDNFVVYIADRCENIIDRDNCLRRQTYAGKRQEIILIYSRSMKYRYYALTVDNGHIREIYDSEISGGNMDYNKVSIEGLITSNGDIQTLPSHFNRRNDILPSIGTLDQERLLYDKVKAWLDNKEWNAKLVGFLYANIERLQ